MYVYSNSIFCEYNLVSCSLGLIFCRRFFSLFGELFLCENLKMIVLCSLMVLHVLDCPQSHCRLREFDINVKLGLRSFERCLCVFVRVSSSFNGFGFSFSSIFATQISLFAIGWRRILIVLFGKHLLIIQQWFGRHLEEHLMSVFIPNGSICFFRFLMQRRIQQFYNRFEFGELVACKRENRN